MSEFEIPEDLKEDHEYCLAEIAKEANGGPSFACQEKYDKDLIERIARLEAEKKILLQALESLGALPDGYCFCWTSIRAAHKSIHTGECDKARAAIAQAAV